MTKNWIGATRTSLHSQLLCEQMQAGLMSDAAVWSIDYQTAVYGRFCAHSMEMRPAHVPLWLTADSTPRKKTAPAAALPPCTDIKVSRQFKKHS